MVTKPNRELVEDGYEVYPADEMDNYLNTVRETLQHTISEIHHSIELLEEEKIDTALERLNDLVVFIANHMVESK